jgi:diguanylate cyclase (GGDEF)-like protein
VSRIEALNIGRTASPYHVLIVDDDPEQISHYALILQQAGMITSVASDPCQVINVMIEAKPELILMDMYMPNCDGIDLAAIIRQQEAFVGIPIVFLSVETDPDLQLSAIRKGADDFLTKPVRPDHLVTSITNRLERIRSVRYFMERDSLTGLLNHSNLKESLAHEMKRARRTGSGLAFAMIDLDHFKVVNDNHGHLAGDRVLLNLASLLQERLRTTDIIGRYGGEEFGIILLNTTCEAARAIMNEVRENFGRVNQHAGGVTFRVTFSCGIAGYAGEGEFPPLTEMADWSLYEAKRRGRNRVVTASEAGTN